MGFLNDIFGTPKKRVSQQEYKKVKSELFGLGFNQRERNKVDEIFKPDFYEKPTESHPRGLEMGEVEARIKWMRENKSKHKLSDNDIDILEKSLKKRI